MDYIGDGDEIARLVARQDAQTLAQVLRELAEDYASVYQRLERLRLSDDPAALMAQFNQRLHRWENDHRYVCYQDAEAFGRSWMYGSRRSSVRCCRVFRARR